MNCGCRLGICVALALGPSLSFAQTSYELQASDESGLAGDTVTAAIFLNNNTAVEAFSFGLSHEPSIADIVDIVPGSVVTATNGGGGPDFFGGNTDPAGGAGGTLGCAISLSGADTLPSGMTQEIALFSYALDPAGVPGSTTPLNFVASLGDPPVPITITVDSMSLPAGTAAGSLAIEQPGFVLRAADTSGPVGTTVVTPVFLDNPGAVEAFSFGIGHDAIIADLVSIDPGAVVSATNGGLGPDFFGGNTDPVGGTGGTLGCAINLSGADTIPSGLDQEIALFGYAFASGVMPGDSTPLDFTSSLGDPPVSTVVTVDNMSLAPVTVSGSLTAVVAEIFRRGDVDNNSTVNIGDGYRLAQVLLQGIGSLTCADAGDTNDDGVLRGLEDTLYLLEYLFAGGPAVPFPNPFEDGCGTDPTDDALDCADYQGSCP